LGAGVQRVAEDFEEGLDFTCRLTRATLSLKRIDPRTIIWLRILKGKESIVETFRVQDANTTYGYRAGY
jgi:hypothetical protein